MVANFFFAMSLHAEFPRFLFSSEIRGCHRCSSGVACSVNLICCTIKCLLFSVLSLSFSPTLTSAPEQRIPRVSSNLRHQQPGRAAQPGQQTQRDFHTRQQHRPGQTVPLLPLQEEHPEVNKGGFLYSWTQMFHKNINSTSSQFCVARLWFEMFYVTGALTWLEI